MNPEVLFVRTIEDCSEAVSAPTDYSLLRATALLRQLLLDENRLLDIVNRARREKIRFTVADPWDTPYVKMAFSLSPSVFSVGDGLDPETNMLPAARIVSISRDEFLKFRVGYSDGAYHSVGDVIRHCAHILGGVHVDSPTSAKDIQLLELQNFTLGGLPLNLMQVRSILSVTVSALRPLSDRIKREAMQQ